MPNTYVNKVTANGQTLIDLTADTAIASDVAQGKYFHLATGERVAGTASGSNDFVVTLSYNDQTDMWEPDCTYAEAYAAYQAGKTIVADAGSYTAASIDYDSGDGCFYYCVREGFSEPNGTMYYNYGIDSHDYIWYSSGVESDSTMRCYATEGADAVPSDVAHGKRFFNASGIQTGTASGGSIYSLDNIVPEQTVACTTFMQNNAYYGLPTFSSPIDAAEQYLVTFDGTEYVCEGYVPERNATGVGDIRVVNTNAAQYLITPFFMEYQTSIGIGLIVRGSGTHTVKVDKLNLHPDS